MALPVYKIVSLVLRVFSKPLVVYVKQTHALGGESSHPYLKTGFANLGNFYHKIETWINRKFKNIDAPQIAFKPLKQELAIEKGIQFFYELMFYSLIIGLPVYEMWRASNEAEVKSKKLERRLCQMDKNLSEMVQKSRKRQAFIAELYQKEGLILKQSAIQPITVSQQEHKQLNEAIVKDGQTPFTPQIGTSLIAPQVQNL